MIDKVKQKARYQRWKDSHPMWEKNYRAKRYLSPRYTYNRLSYRAKSRGIDFNMSVEEFSQWFDLQKKECFYCGITLEQASRSTDTMLRRFCKTLSVDRLDNNGAYEVKNIVFSCQRCNFIKGDYFNWQEMRRLANEFIKPKIKSL